MKKIVTLLLAVCLLASALAGCASSAKTENKTIVVGASSTPHAEILEQVKDTLAKDGWTLEIKVFDDYVLPNKALADGELDANYFQHTPYLVSDLSELAEGATIIIPADDSNETRALLLLQQEGLIELPADASAAKGVTVLDIVDDHGYSIQPVQADTVPAQLKNANPGTIAVINGNYALQAGLHSSDALALESADGDAAQTYANIVACRKGDENSEKIQALISALQSDAVKQYIADTYNGAVVAIF